jgi:arsenate reductase
VLVAIIIAVGPVSGARPNPRGDPRRLALGRIRGQDGLAYGFAQVGGGIAGTIAAQPDVLVASRGDVDRGQLGRRALALEVVATFGLLLVIFGGVRSGRGAAVPFGVGAYIGGAHWFTSSTSFAHPAVMIARTLSNTFAGIAPASAAPFIGAQLAGSLLAMVVVRALYPATEEVAAAVVVPHSMESRSQTEEAGDPPAGEGVPYWFACCLSASITPGAPR